MYCDCFEMHSIRIFTEEVVNGEVVTKCHFKLKLDLYSPPVFFVANIIKSEGVEKAAKAHDKPLK